MATALTTEFKPRNQSPSPLQSLLAATEEHLRATNATYLQVSDLFSHRLNQGLQPAHERQNLLRS